MSIHPLRLLRAPALRMLDSGDGTARLAIDGLVCTLCASRAAAALASVPGVRALRIDLARAGVDVEHDGDGADMRALGEALQEVVLLPRARRMIDALGATLCRGRARGRGSA
jgi:copper chaperone CopZ